MKFSESYILVAAIVQIHTLQAIQRLNEVIRELNPCRRHRSCGVAILPRGVAIFHAASPSLRGVAIIAASPSLRRRHHCAASPSFAASPSPVVVVEHAIVAIDIVIEVA